MRKYFVGWVAAIALSMPVAASAGFSNMYVLGDSLSDNGNLYNWTGAPNPVTEGLPIPVTVLPPGTDLPPGSDLPLGTPLYSAGRFENGKSYSERLWTEHASFAKFRKSMRQFICGVKSTIAGYLSAKSATCWKSTWNWVE